VSAFKQYLAIGLSVLGYLFSFLLAPKQKREIQDNSPKANWGADIPRIFDEVEIGTNVIWASSSDQVQQRQGKGGIGGGGGKKENRTDRASFVVLIGEGERHWNKYVGDGIQNGGLLSLVEIKFNDKVWDSGINLPPGQLNQSSSGGKRAKREAKREAYSFYNGSQTQQKDPFWIAQVGEEKVTALQGYSYIVFRNVIIKDYGNQIPTVKVRVRSNLPAIPRVIIKDLMVRSGIWNNQPLIDNIDWRLIGNLNPSSIQIQGFIMSQSGNSAMDVMTQLAQIFQFTLLQNGGLNQNSLTNVYDQSTLVAMHLFSQQKYEANQRGLLGAQSEGTQLPSAFNIDTQDPNELPVGAEVSFINPTKDYERSTVTVWRRTPGHSEIRSINLNAVINNQATIMVIGSFAIQEAFYRVGTQVEYRVPDLMPHSLLGTMVLSDPNLLESTIRGLVLKFTLGADGIIESHIAPQSLFRALPTITNTDSLSLLSGGPPNGSFSIDTSPPPPPAPPNLGEFEEDVIPLPPAGDTLVPPALFWWEGLKYPSTLTNNPRQSDRSINIVLHDFIEAQATIAIEVFYSLDGGSSWFNTNVTGGTNGQQLEILSVTPANLRPKYQPFVIDRETVITVKTPTWISLSDIPVETAFDFQQNVVYIRGLGVSVFTEAELVDVNTYELRGWIFNINQTYWDTSYAIPDNCYLIQTPLVWNLPSSIPLGANLVVSSLPAGETITQHQDTYRGLHAYPRPVGAMWSRILPNSHLEINWARGIQQDTDMSSLWGEEQPVDEIPEVFEVRIYTSSLASTPTHTAMVTNDFQYIWQNTGAKTNIHYEVISRGNLGQVTPANGFRQPVVSS
jgi:hypothetical protein